MNPFENGVLSVSLSQQKQNSCIKEGCYSHQYHNCTCLQRNGMETDHLDQNNTNRTYHNIDHRNEYSNCSGNEIAAYFIVNVGATNTVTLCFCQLGVTFNKAMAITLVKASALFL